MRDIALADVNTTTTTTTTTTITATTMDNDNTVPRGHIRRRGVLSKSPDRTHRIRSLEKPPGVRSI